MHRRHFLQHSSLGIAGMLLATGPGRALAGLPSEGTSPPALDRWDEIRALFPVDPSYVHMAGLLLASHPEDVASALEEYRDALDANPVRVWALLREGDAGAREAAARYAGADATDVALTTSTTMGLAIAVNGFHLSPGDEILQTTHDHMVMDRSIEYKAEKSGASVRKVALYDEDRPERADAGEVVERFRGAIRPETRVVGATWVHSNSGVKLPVAALSEVVREANGGRDEEERISFLVDGVHGFGVEEEGVDELGCDFFSAGTHKWLFGPRGTGILWGRPEIQHRVTPTIPAFGGQGWGGRMSPGGFQAFEHRWAVAEAFDFHLGIGKGRVRDRIHELNGALKEGLTGMDHVRLHTPRDPALSSGIVCFSVRGMSRGEVVDRLLERHRIIASTAWGRPGAARFTAGLLNDLDDVEACLEAVRAMA